MRRPKAPLFLGRASYRRRRLSDAARMLPVVGAFLVLLPILWSPGQTPAPDTGVDGIYLFGVWAALIAGAAALAPVLRGKSDPMEPPPESGGDS